MIAIAIVGLVLPGYFLARALRAPYCWAVAFPLSAVLLTEIVIVYTCAGIPLRWVNVLAPIVVVSLICIAWCLRRKSPSVVQEAAFASQNAPRALAIVVSILVGLVLLGLAIRTSLHPLSGYDTVFRWNELALLMLKHQGLWYYPPVTADDFVKYTYPDGFPPLVSSVYWWLYAGWGQSWAALTSLPVVLQAVSCLALVYYAATMLFGRTGGLMALAVLACGTEYVKGVAIGQETGYTALSYAGQLAFAFAAVRQPRASHVVISGMFAALGALAREYGPLLALSGLAVLAINRQTRRYVPLFCLVVAALGGLWYARNWVLTGNPFYPIDLGLGLPDNPILAGVMKTYHEMLGLHQYSLDEWCSIIATLLVGAPLILLVGVPSSLLAGRSGVALGIAAALSILFWIWSVPFTAGGVPYSMRVLTPAYVALAIASGALGRWLTAAAQRENLLLHQGVTFVIIVCGAFAVASCWSHPQPLNALPQSIFEILSDPQAADDADNKIARQLEGSDLPATDVLTDSSYLAIALSRHSRFRPVMIWSPEVRFVFDRQLPLWDVRQRLRDKNIRLIAEANWSLNDYYLDQFPLFHEPQKALEIYLKVPDVQTILLIKDEAVRPPRASSNPRP